MNAVSGVNYVTGRSFVGDLGNALQVARTDQFVSSRGDRISAPNVIIVLMNGGVDVDSPTVSLQLFITFCVSRRGRKMYCGHACLCVRLSVCPRPYAHTIARTRM